MMPNLFPLLLATSVVAEMTTFFWQPLGGTFPTGRPLFAASIMDVNDDKTTMLLGYHKDLDHDNLHLASFWNATVTYASTLWEYTTFLERYAHHEETTTTGPTTGIPGYEEQYICQRTSVGSGAICTVSAGSILASRQHCAVRYAHNASTDSIVYTFTAEGTTLPALTETVYYTINSQSSTQNPDWCTIEGADTPESARVSEYDIPEGQIETFSLIITAGEEKLSATTGAAASTSGAQMTSTSGGVVSDTPDTTEPTVTESGPIEATGAAVPMKTVGPALAGLGAAVAAFFL